VLGSIIGGVEQLHGGLDEGRVEWTDACSQIVPMCRVASGS